MPTLTRNLFWGRGEGDDLLEVVEGRWPDDVEGAVFIIGPDKRRPGGHWFGEQGLLCRIDLRADPQGRVRVRHRRVRTPVDRIRRRVPWLFAKVSFLELSPFGLSNFANTNVQGMGGRLFIGYDGGRPIEVDPETLSYLTPVGANDEWYGIGPGLLEPPVSVAAHPAPDVEEGCLWFVNYSPLPVGRRTFVARWDLEGEVVRWEVDGMGEFDSIHDIKSCRDYLVFADLPFVVDPEVLRGGPPGRPNQDHTSLWIVSKADLATLPHGGTVHAREVRIPFPTGHLSLDYDNPPGEVRVFLEHIPLADLMITLGRDDLSHGTGTAVDANYEGLPTLAVQPGALGRYLIAADTGEVREADVAWDPRFWGAVLATKDESSAAARGRCGDLWYAGMGFDPDLVPERWWQLYSGAGLAHLVAPADLPASPVPAALARFDREEMKVAEVFPFEEGAFPHPPTFVPRKGGTEPGDGYVVVVVHREGAKEIALFDAREVESGPVARASAPRFNPPMLLHSCWMEPRSGPRPSAYRVGIARDMWGSMRSLPGLIRTWWRLGPELRDYVEAQRSGGGPARPS